jgi:hypothetical protein
MHTLHYIAVQAENKQEAFDKVVVALSPNEDGYRLADWSDWHVVGGGRWSTNAQKANDILGGYNNDPTDVLGFSEDKEKFQETLTNVGKWRSNAMNRAIKEIYNEKNYDRFISDMVDYASNGGRLEYNGDTIMLAYTIKEAAEMLMGGWIPDSGFYDLEEHIAEITYLKERLDKPEQSALQYLVPVDFHF